MTMDRDRHSDSTGYRQHQQMVPAGDFGEISYDDLDFSEGPSNDELTNLSAEVLSSTDMQQLAEHIVAEESVLPSIQITRDTVAVLLCSGEEPAHLQKIFELAQQRELAGGATDFIQHALSDVSFRLTADIQRNVIVLADELRTYGETDLVEKLNDFLLGLSEEVPDPAMQGRALLECFDFLVERSDLSHAHSYLQEAILYLYEAQPSDQVVLLPRIQTMLEFSEQPLDEGGIVLSPAAERALLTHFERILENSSVPMAPEVLEARLWPIRNALEGETALTPLQLDALEEKLYPLATLLREQAGLEDLLGETVAMIGDVLHQKNSPEAAANCYLNAITLFQQVAGGETESQVNTMLTATRQKVIPLLKQLPARRYQAALRENLRLSGQR